MAQLNKKTIKETYTHQRGWGVEYWIENLPEYCGKLLVLENGKRCSLHFHMKKRETMYLQAGAVDILFVDPDTGKEYTVELYPGDSIMIPPGQVHQIINHQNGSSLLFEFSTMHEEADSYRVRKGD